MNHSVIWLVIAVTLFCLNIAAAVLLNHVDVADRFLRRMMLILFAGGALAVFCGGFLSWHGLARMLHWCSCGSGHGGGGDLTLDVDW